MLRLVRRPRGLVPPLCALFVALTGVAASAAAQTFTVRVSGNMPGYGRGTVTSSPAGIDCTFLGTAFEFSGTGTCVASFPAGATVVLSVATKDGTTHGGWSGDCAAFTSDCTLVVDQNRTTGLILNPAKFKVTLSLSGNGAGNVVETEIFTQPRLGCVIAAGQVTGTCETDYALGSRVTLEFRIPFSSGTQFKGFNVPPCVDAVACRAVVTGPITITGAFVTPEIRVSGAGTGSGRVVGSAPSGVDCTITPSGTTGTCERVFDKNTPALTTFTATPSDGSFFVGWSGLCSGAGVCTTLGAVPPNGGLVARFDAQPAGVVSLFLTGAGGFGRARVTSSPAGIDCDFSDPALPDGTGTCRGDFPASSTVQLTATPRDGTKVLAFTGDCESTSATCTLVMHHDRRVTVQLDPARFPVTIAGAGNGSGNVNGLNSPADPRIQCVVTRGVTSGTCVAQYPFGSTALLGTSLAGSSKLVGYGVPPCVNSLSCMANVTGPMTVTVTFTAPAITITGNGTGSGRIVDAGAGGLDCTVSPAGNSGTCSRNSDATQATPISFIAAPSVGSVFVGWTGLCSGSGPCTTAGDFPPNTQLVAQFDLQPGHSAVVLTIGGAGTGNGLVTVAPGNTQCQISGGGVVANASCDITFGQPTKVTLTAEPRFGSTFGGWIGNACTGTELTCTFTLSTSTTVAASFISPHSPHDLTLELAGRMSLTAEERAQLDRLGNNNGRFDLGDVLAYLDRTGQKLTPTDAAAAATSSKPAAPTATKPRRVP